MGTAELLTVLGIGLLTAGTLALVFTLGKWWGERGAARDYVDRLHAMNEVERMRRAAHSAPVHLDGRRTARENITIDLGEVMNRMGKHDKANAPGTDAQRKREQEAAEAEELRKLEQKLRRQGKIK